MSVSVNSVAHTALPWDLAADGATVIQVEQALIVADCLTMSPNLMTSAEAGANARLICRAVNAYEDLVAALQAVEAHHVHLNEKHGRAPGRSRTLGIVRTALAKVHEVQP